MPKRKKTEPETLELKPCPFCGGEAEIHDFSCDDYTTAWAGSCKDDDCSGWVTANYFHSAHSLKEAVERWNRRAGGKDADHA